ncbi:methyltransferase domain-containing protein [Haloglomus halophilum]|uniref:methyltransferase domain-containing protein n=1 Tax=Haloglomus halophilum TaxID=2962672 RepID=UPI0020C95545|nr:class I SAM-dependent methyltransferase [Haloglomus halophilum]
MSDPFGRAVRDHHEGARESALVQRDGTETLDHPIDDFYFSTYDAEADPWLADALDGPLLDLGSGAGRRALAFQRQFETVATDVSEQLVAVAADRGVEDARVADMFALREPFERDRFASALAIGTQVGLAGSMGGLRAFLADLAHVTTPDATAVIDGYDPASVEEGEMLGYRSRPERGLAHRVFHFEYEGEVGETLLFILFGPERLSEATVGTDWWLADTDAEEDDVHYRARLEKR